jgi:hypothetical protein
MMVGMMNGDGNDATAKKRPAWFIDRNRYRRSSRDFHSDA